MSRPRIGVTTSARSGWRIFPLIALSVWWAGGRPVWWRVGKPAEIDTVDGIIVGGGDDISAELYDGRIVAESRIDPERDALERSLVHQAHERELPIFGICRGAQMINVALGGSLHQDIYTAYAGARRLWTILPKKTVSVQDGTRLAAICGTEPMRVNALHTQSVDRFGDGLRAAARDEYGIVQSVERPGGPFMLGVQWHPEHLFYARRQRALFRALIAAARNSSSAGGRAHGPHPEQQDIGCDIAPR